MVLLNCRHYHPAVAYQECHNHIIRLSIHNRRRRRRRLSHRPISDKLIVHHHQHYQERNHQPQRTIDTTIADEHLRRTRHHCRSKLVETTTTRATLDRTLLRRRIEVAIVRCRRRRRRTDGKRHVLRPIGMVPITIIEVEIRRGIRTEAAAAVARDIRERGRDEARRADTRIDTRKARDVRRIDTRVRPGHRLVIFAPHLLDLISSHLTIVSRFKI